jgi:hypothetical protein
VTRLLVLTASVTAGYTLATVITYVARQEAAHRRHAAFLASAVPVDDFGVAGAVQPLLWPSR